VRRRVQTDRPAPLFVRHVLELRPERPHPLAGTFLLLMTVTVDPHGNTFSGKFVSDQLRYFRAIK